MYEERPSILAGATVWTDRRSPHDAVPVRVLPDGCIDVIWLDGRLVIAGPDTSAHVSAGRPGAVNVAVRFDPGIAPIVLDVPAHTLRDQRVPLDAVLPGAEVRRLDEMLVDALTLGGIDEAARTLERELAARFGSRERDAWVPEAVRRLDEGSAVAAVADHVGFSERQFLRRCDELFGYGPRLLARVRRVGRALDRARAGDPPAFVAAECGYSDQSHLARDVRVLTGLSLTGLLAEERARSAGASDAIGAS